MTVECTNIESILGPLRKFTSNRMISLRSSIVGEKTAAWSAVKWTSTSEPPVSDWLGNRVFGGSHDDALRRMRIAAFIAFMDSVPLLAEGHPWCLLDHQCGGVVNSNRRFLGRRVLLKPAIEIQLLGTAKRDGISRSTAKDRAGL
jgi:hypothetical protein